MMELEQFAVAVSGDAHLWAGAADDKREWELCQPDSGLPGWFFCRALGIKIKGAIGQGGGAAFRAEEGEAGVIFHCKLVFGKGAWQFGIDSAPSESAGRALASAIEATKARPAELDTHEPFRQILAGRGYDYIPHLSFLSAGIHAPPSFRCELQWHGPHPNSAMSDWHPSRTQAFEEAIHRMIPAHAASAHAAKRDKEMRESALKEAQLQLALANAEAKRTKAAIAASLEMARKELSKKAALEAKALASRKKQAVNKEKWSDFFRSARSRWCVEHAWMLKKADLTPKERERLRALHNFLILSDYARLLELATDERPSAVARLREELERLNALQSPPGQRIEHQALLRVLCGAKGLDAGVQIKPGPEYESKARSMGLDPSLVLTILVERKLLRREREGYATSTLGANLLEERLGPWAKPGALGLAIPAEVLAALSQIVQ